jgi:transposase InsO family protein
VSLRKEFVDLAMVEGADFLALSVRFGISRKTGYKWLSRFRREGEAGLSDRSRRPKTSPTQTDAAVERAVLTVRDEHPSWGGRKIRHVLQRDALLPSLPGPPPSLPVLPVPSTITQILRRNGRLDPEECAKHEPCRRFERSEPNDLWQMDFKGDFGLSAGGRCHPLTVLDDHSRFCLLLAACHNEQGAAVQQHLVGCFRANGLPGEILSDNGPPWGGGGAMRHTSLSAWLIRLGVTVLHGRPWHPQTQGKEERFHRTLMDELIRPVMGLTVAWNVHASSAAKPGSAASQSGKTVHTPDHAACQKLFDPFRSMYNQVRPHEAIGMQTPHSLYRASKRPYPETLPPVEYDNLPGQHIRKVQQGGAISFQNRTLHIGNAFGGQPVAIRHTETNGLYEVFFCHQRITCIDLRTQPLTGGRIPSSSVTHVSEQV